MEDSTTEIVLIYISVLIALAWSLFNALAIKMVKVSGDTEVKFDNSEDKGLNDVKKLEMVELIGKRISDGANAFLFAEYVVMCIFIGVFAVIICVVVDVFGHGETAFRLYATIAFIVGSFTSMLCGFIGMRIAVASNFRTTFRAM